MSRFHFAVAYWPCSIGAVIGVFCHNRVIIIPQIGDVSGLFTVTYEIALMAFNANKIALWELYFVV